MHLWTQLEILKNKKRHWLFGKDNNEGRINALNNILNSGLPGAIPNLIPFLRDDDSEVRNLTCNIIIELFSKISTRKRFYETVKNSDISRTDLDYYKRNFSVNNYVTLLGIASLNYNGYIREAAVQMLAATMDASAIQFIIYRLADWVEKVREAAIKGLENFKRPEFLNGMIENIKTFEWLQLVERVDLSSCYAGVMNFIIIQNKNHVLKDFCTYSDKTRIIIAKHLTRSDAIEAQDLQLLLSDKLFLVRSLALNNFEKFNEAQIHQLLNDKSARVRYGTLYKLKDAPGFKKLAMDFIADNSATIRNFARYALKGAVKDFASIYHHNLLNGQKLIGSISGIAETNGKDFIATIEPFLQHQSVRIKKCAFLALKKLDESKAYNFALANLDSGSAGLRNLIINFLEKRATNEILEKARIIYQDGNYDLKKSMLKLFSKIGKWTTIADLIIGTINEDTAIRDLSVQYVNRWKGKTNSYFLLPKPAELERTNQVFNIAYTIHEEKKYYQFNPLSGFDFYLK